MRVLFLTHRLPYAPNRGDRVRAYHMIRALASRVELELVSLAHDEEELSHADRIRALGVRVGVFRTSPLTGYARAILSLAGRQPVTHTLLDAPGLAAALDQLATERPPDVVLAYCSGMARFAVEPRFRTRPIVIDFVDVDSAKWATLARTAIPPKRWIYAREATCLAQFEQRAALTATTNLVVNEKEQTALHELAPMAAVQVMSNGVDLGELRPSSPPAVEPRVIFCGVMNYEPNEAAVIWFAREVWPRVVAVHSNARFVIVGSSPTPAVQRLKDEGVGIDVTGTVADVRPYLWGAAVSVAPLTTARGIQNKVLEALAAGLPTVVTSQVFEGLPLEARPGCRVADSREGFAEGVLSLLALSPTERRTVAERARLDALSWDSQMAGLPQILSEAATTGRP